MFDFLTDAVSSARSAVSSIFSAPAAEPARPAPAPAAARPPQTQTATPPAQGSTGPATGSPQTDGQAATQTGEPAAAPRRPAPDPAAMSQAAADLFQAMDGMGTNEDAIHAALRGKSPEEVASIRAAYSDHYPGHDLDADISDEMSGDDLAAAQAALTGDRVAAATASLVNSASGWGTDEAGINATLEGITDPGERQAVARAYEQQTGRSLDAMLEDELSDNDLELSRALASGDTSGARAVRMDEAMNGGFLGLGMGTDEDTVYSQIESCRNQDERDALARSYRERTGRDLSVELADELATGAESDVATSLMSGDAAGAAAARLSVASDGAGTDESAIFRQLEGKTGPQRQAIIDAYNARYGSATGGANFDDMIHDELGAMDEERAKQLAANGRLDPEFALEYAMDGVGTDEAMIRATLQGKSQTQIDEIRAAFRTRTGRDLDADLADENSGRDGFEITQMMQGEPRTPEERIARMDAAYEFTRGEGAGVFGNAVMDVFSDNGRMLDLQHQRLEELGDRLRSGESTPEDLARLETVAGYQRQDVTNYQASQDAVTNGLATGATIAVGAIVTVATAGAASPAVVAALAALAGGAAGMGIKAGMLGDSYANEQIGIDAAQTLVSAASAGLLKAEAVQGMMGAIAGVAPGATATLAQSVAIGTMGGAAGGLISGTATGLLDENTWRGEGNGALGFLGTVGGSVLTGSVSGAATSLAAGGLNAAGIAQQNPNGTANAVNSIAAGTLGGMAGTAATAGTFNGRIEDIAGRFGQSAATSLVAGAADAHATGVHEGMTAAAKRLGVDPAEMYSGANRAAVQAEAANPTVAAPPPAQTVAQPHQPAEPTTEAPPAAAQVEAAATQQQVVAEAVAHAPEAAAANPDGVVRIAEAAEVITAPAPVETAPAAATAEPAAAAQPHVDPETPAAQTARAAVTDNPADAPLVAETMPAATAAAVNDSREVAQAVAQGGSEVIAPVVEANPQQVLEGLHASPEAQAAVQADSPAPHSPGDLAAMQELIDRVASPEAATMPTKDMPAERSSAIRTDEVRALMDIQESMGIERGAGMDQRMVDRADRQQAMVDSLTEMHGTLTPDQMALAELAADARRGANTTGVAMTAETHGNLQDLAAGVGLPPETVASMTPEMRLLVAGFTPDEIAQHFTARDVDADVIRDAQNPTRDTAERGSATGPKAAGDVNTDGSVRRPMTVGETQRAVDVNATLFEGFQEGGQFGKLIPEATVGGAMSGNSGYGDGSGHKVGGDLGELANTNRAVDGTGRPVTSLDQNQVAGLDYPTAEKSGYITDPALGPIEVGPSITNPQGLHRVEGTITEGIFDAAEVCVGAAVMNQAELQAAALAKAQAEGLAPHIPTMLESAPEGRVDASGKVIPTTASDTLPHVMERQRDTQADTRTGLGYSTTERLDLPTVPNQELSINSRTNSQALPDDARITSTRADGTQIVALVRDASGNFVMTPEVAADPVLSAYYANLLAQNQAKYPPTP